MDPAGDVAVALAAADGVIDKLELWSELTAQEAQTLTAYQTLLGGSSRTTKGQDGAFKMIFDRYWMKHIG